MKVTPENRHAVHDITPDLEKFVNEHYSPYNNARRIVLGQVSRIYGKYKKTLNKKYVWLAQILWGMDLDYITGQDDGEEPERKGFDREEDLLKDSVVAEPVDSDEPY